MNFYYFYHPITGRSHSCIESLVFSAISAMLNPLELTTVTADHTGRSLLFRFLGSTQLSSTSESSVELNYLGRPK